MRSIDRRTRSEPLEKHGYVYFKDPTTDEDILFNPEIDVLYLNMFVATSDMLRSLEKSRVLEKIRICRSSRSPFGLGFFFESMRS